MPFNSACYQKAWYLDTLLRANGYFSLQILNNVPNIKKVHFVRDITPGLNDSRFLLQSRETQFSLVPERSLVCEECPLGLSAFLSIRPPQGLKKHQVLL